MALANNKAWYDKCFISVSPKGGNEVELRAKTTSLSISGGGFDIEGIETFGGKTKRIGTPDDIEISFDAIPIQVSDLDWIRYGVTSSATTVTSSTVKDHRVTFLWTDQTGVTAATQAIQTGSEAYRRIYAGANCTSLEYNMDAGEHLTATLGFKLSYEDETGSVNFKFETSETGSSTSAVPAYTSTTKF